MSLDIGGLALLALEALGWCSFYTREGLLDEKRWYVIGFVYLCGWL